MKQQSLRCFAFLIFSQFKVREFFCKITKIKRALSTYLQLVTLLPGLSCIYTGDVLLAKMLATAMVSNYAPLALSSLCDAATNFEDVLLFSFFPNLKLEFLQNNKNQDSTFNLFAIGHTACCSKLYLHW